MYKRNYLFLDLAGFFLSGACVKTLPETLFTSFRVLGLRNSLDAIFATRGDVFSFAAITEFLMVKAAKVRDFSKRCFQTCNFFAKKFADSKTMPIFAPSLPETSFLNIICAVIFLAASLAANAKIKGYHSDGYCATCSVIVSGETGEGSLSSYTLFNNLNYSFMPETMSNVSRVEKSPKARITPEKRLNGTKAVTAPVGAYSIRPQSAGTPAEAANPKKHYYIISLRAIGHFATDYRGGLFVSRILRAVSKEEAIGYLCNYVKEHFPQHSILAKDITCDTFNFINPKI